MSRISGHVPRPISHDPIINALELARPHIEQACAVQGHEVSLYFVNHIRDGNRRDQHAVHESDSYSIQVRVTPKITKAARRDLVDQIKIHTAATAEQSRSSASEYVRPQSNDSVSAGVLADTIIGELVDDEPSIGYKRVYSKVREVFHSKNRSDWPSREQIKEKVLSLR